MYKTIGKRQVNVNQQGVLEMVEVEIGADICLLNEDTEAFDLYEWAKEFAQARWY